MRFFISGIEGRTRQSQRLSDELGAQHLDITSDTILEGAKELLNSMPQGTHDLIGVSFGGLCCWQAALLEPERIDELYLIRVLTHLNEVPLSVRLQRRMLPFIPSFMFEQMYQRRHPEVFSPLKKDQIRTRLDSIWNAFPEMNPKLPIYWINPVGAISFGRQISEDMFRDVIRKKNAEQ